MKHNKNVIALIVILALLYVGYGCKDSAKQNINVDKTIQNGKQTTNKSEDVQSFPDKLENPNVSILVHVQKHIDSEFAEAKKIFEEKYGGKITYTMVTYGEKPEKLATSISAGDAFDVIRWEESNGFNYFIKSFLQPLENYVNMKDPVWIDSMNMTEAYKFGGKCYGMSAGPQFISVIYNKTLFENNGLKTPIEYYKEGKWNWNTMKEAAIKLTQDTNGDGSIDQWGVGGSNFGLYQLCASNGVEMANFSENMEVTHNFDDRVRDAMQLYSDAMFKDKYYGGKNVDNFVSGKVGMYFTWDNEALKGVFSSMKYEWDMVPYPMGSAGSPDIFPGGSGFWGISTGAKNPEGAGVMIYLRQKSYQENERDELLKVYSKDQVDLIMKIRTKTIIGPRVKSIGQFDKLTKQLQSALDKGTPVATVIEESLPLYQQEIDIIMKEISEMK